MDLTEIRWDGVDWIHMVQDRYRWQAVVHMVMSLWGPWQSFLATWATVSYWRRTLPRGVGLV